MTVPAYKDHLCSSEDLVTTYEATRAGFVMLALEKNQRATPFVAEARALQEAASAARTPADLLTMNNIRAGLLTAAGLSDKSLGHLQPADMEEALKNLIKNFLEPAGVKFVEELVFRFLLTRGDTLRAALRNIAGAIAQRKIARAIASTLTIAGIPYRWQDTRSNTWSPMSDERTELETPLRGMDWDNERGRRTLICNLKVPFIGNNIDMCLFDGGPDNLGDTKYGSPASYIALGELKGGIDPAGADEHWKTARTALERIRKAFRKAGRAVAAFFVAAAVENNMAKEIWADLKKGTLANAANLTNDKQVTSICRWLCNL